MKTFVMAGVLSLAGVLARLRLLLGDDHRAVKGAGDAVQVLAHLGRQVRGVLSIGDVKKGDPVSAMVGQGLDVREDPFGKIGAIQGDNDVVKADGPGGVGNRPDQQHRQRRPFHHLPGHAAQQQAPYAS